MKRCSPRFAQLLVLLLSSAMVGAQTPPPAANPRNITPNWVNADLATVAEGVGAANNITFIIDQRVRANVTLYNPRPMTRQELYYAFLNILQVYGFAAVRDGNSNRVKIVPDTVARNLPGNDLPANLNSLGSDEMVTAVLEVKNINVLQVAQVLRSFGAQYGQVMPVPGTNTMIVYDRASNVVRLEALLKRVDQSSNASWELIPLQNAVAADVVRTITPLIAAQPNDAAGGAVARIQADDRTNSVVVSGDPAQRLRIAALVEQLDAPGSDGGGTRIFALKYAKAEDLAATLKGQVAGAAAQTNRPPGAAGAGAAPATSSASAIADRDANILPDAATNKLIITAAPRTMLALAAIIEELDIAPAQVHIEAIIADVSDTQAADLGVNWAVFSDEEGTKVPASAFIAPVGGTSIVDLAQTISDPASATNVPLGGTFGVGLLRDNGLNFAAMLRALRSDTRTNVVSTPSVTARNNVESEMNSVKEVPLLSGTYTTGVGGGGGGGVGGGGIGNPFTTVNRQEVGTILKVTPQIIPGEDEVILDINLESSGLSGQSGDAGSLITNKRSVITSVRVRSGTTIVIGGMMSDSKDTDTTRIPFLSRIPLLGELFKARGSQRDKSILMIFIKPTILADAVQAHALTNSKQNDVRDLQRLQNNHKELLPLLPFDTPPELPELAPFKP